MHHVSWSRQLVTSASHVSWSRQHTIQLHVNIRSNVLYILIGFRYAHMVANRNSGGGGGGGIGCGSGG